MATRLQLRERFENRDIAGLSGFRDMVTTAGATATTAVVTATASGTNIIWTKTAGGETMRWISPPLASGFTLSGNVTYNIRALESAATVNAGGRSRLYKYSGGTETLISGPNNDGVEFTTTQAAYNWVAAPTSTSFAAGDRIIVEYYITNQGTMAAGTCTLRYDGAAAGTSDSYVEITENVTFSAETPNIFGLIATTTGTDTSIEIPSGATAGDRMIILNEAYNSSATIPTNVTPSGFSAIGTSATGVSNGGSMGVRYSAWFKDLVGGETTLTGMSGGNGQQWRVFLLRPQSGYAFGTIADINAEVAANPAVQTININGASDAGIFVVGHYGNFAQSRILSMSVIDQSLQNTFFDEGYKSYRTSPGSDITVDATNDSFFGGLGSFYIPVNSATTEVTLAGTDPADTGSFAADVVTVTTTFAGTDPADTGSFAASIVTVSITLAGDDPVDVGDFAASVVTTDLALAGDDPIDVGAFASDIVTTDLALAGDDPVDVGAFVSDIVTTDLALAGDDPVDVGAFASDVVTTDLTLAGDDPIDVGAFVSALQSNDITLAGDDPVDVGAFNLHSGGVALAGDDPADVGAFAFDIVTTDLTLAGDDPADVGAFAFNVVAPSLTFAGADPDDVGAFVADASAGLFTLAGNDPVDIGDFVLEIVSVPMALAGDDPIDTGVFVQESLIPPFEPQPMVPIQGYGGVNRKRKRRSVSADFSAPKLPPQRVVAAPPPPAPPKAAVPLPKQVKRGASAIATYEAQKKRAMIDEHNRRVAFLLHRW